MMTRRAARHASISRALSLGGILCFAGLLFAACGNDQKGLPEAECSKLRSEAYKLITSGKDSAGHGCATDADCAETKWPECRRAVNTKNNTLIQELQKKFTDGKCKSEAECAESPPVYCNQGLCALREPGKQE